MRSKYLLLLLALGFASELAAQQAPKKKIKVKGSAVSVKDGTIVVPGANGEVKTVDLNTNTVRTGYTSEQLKAAAPQFAATITANDLKKHLVVLASDEYEGRETGEKGQKMAAEYIALQFAADGLQPPPGLVHATNPYYQSFELERRSWGEVYLKTGDKKAEFLKDFYSLGADIPEEISLPVVFVGYGIEEGAYSDYKNTDVAGKALIVLAGEPTDAKGNSLVTGTAKASAWATDWRAKQRLATSKGAKAVFFVADGSQKDFVKTIARLHHWIEEPTMGFPSEQGRQTRAAVFFVSPDLGAQLLGTTTKKLDAYRAKVKSTAKAVASPFKSQLPPVVVKAQRKHESFITENVLGYIPGTDLKDEVLIITAHYDHIGIQDGKVYNGADDDGSGTVAVIEMAQAFAQAKAAGYGPRRSILFMPVTGEEKGLLGSEYYTKNPVFPLEQTVANLNIDMIGRLDEKYKNNKNYVYIIGSDRLSTDLHEINEKANEQHTRLKLDYTYNDPKDPNQFYYRSDHYNFAKNGIPIIFYFNGVHEDYHQATDEVDKILFDKMETITRLVFHTAWEIANRDQRPVVDKPAE